jgi:hypothetical protein
MQVIDGRLTSLKMRLHDLQIGGFSAVVKRHGKAALESVAFAEVHKEMIQLEFPWDDHDEHPDPDATLDAVDELNQKYREEAHTA